MLSLSVADDNEIIQYLNNIETLLILYLMYINKIDFLNCILNSDMKK